MSKLGASAAAAAIACACLLGTTGCVIEGSEGPGPGVPVSGPPPAAMEEQRTPPPNPHTVWVAGYWHWTGMQYTWIPGHWEQGHPGQHWKAPSYSMHEGTYFYEPGRWAGH